MTNNIQTYVLVLFVVWYCCCFTTVCGDNPALIMEPQYVINTVAGVSGMYGYSGDGGPALNALFNVVEGVTLLNSAGDFLVSDIGNNVIRKVVNSTGVITTFVGNGTNMLSTSGK